MPDTSALPQAAGVLFVTPEGHGLFLKRGADSDHAGDWCFPGGGIEDGETAEQAASREAQEEIGRTPDELILTDRNGSQGVDFTTFKSNVPDEFEPTLNGEHTEFRWAPLHEPPWPLHPGVDAYLRAGHMTSERAALDDSTGEIEGESPSDASGMDERQIDTNGWAEIKDNPISKVGVFEYRGSLIKGAPDPSKTYRVYRPEEELSSSETMDSFKLLPWVDNHAMLGDGAGLVPAEKKGVQGVIGQDVHFQGDTLYGNLKVFSSALAGLIDAGKRELSCGYRCTYDWTPGVWNGEPYDCVQRNIRGNHLALVKNGRMGPDVAVLDHSDADRFVFTCDSTFEVSNMPDEITNTGAEEGATSGGASLQDMRTQFATFLSKLDETLQLAAALKGVLGGGEGAEASAASAAPAKEAEDAAGAGAASETEAVREDDATSGAEASPAMDEAAITRAVSTRIAARDRIAVRLSKHVGTFDSSAMDEHEVAEYGVRKLGIKGIQKGHEMTALDVYLSAVKAPSERPATAATGMDGAGGNWLNKQRTALGRS